MAPRGLLIVNPNATSTTRATRLVLERALKSALDLDVALTRVSGDGAKVAASSTHDVIVVLGGDGTVNDVTSGLIDFTTGKSRGPRLAVVPGGSTNVFARAIGMPADPVDATAHLLAALETGSRREISIGGLTVGELPERTFLFAAGMGIDGHTVALMEKARRPFGLTPRGISPLRYAGASLLAMSKMRPELNVHVDGALTPRRAALAIATTNPVWTYFGKRPLSLTPNASFDDGLGLFTLDRLLPGTAAVQLWSLVRTGQGAPQGAQVEADISTLAVTSSQALPVQADGEALAPATTIRMRSLRQALTVLV